MVPFGHILTVHSQICVSLAVADFSDTSLSAAECGEVTSAIDGCTAPLESLLKID